MSIPGLIIIQSNSFLVISLYVMRESLIFFLAIIRSSNKLIALLFFKKL